MASLAVTHAHTAQPYIAGPRTLDGAGVPSGARGSMITTRYAPWYATARRRCSAHSVAGRHACERIASDRHFTARPLPRATCPRGRPSAADLCPAVLRLRPRRGEFGVDGACVVLVGPVLQRAHTGVVEVQQTGEVELGGPMRGKLLQGLQDAGQPQEGRMAEDPYPYRSGSGVIDLDLNARSLPGGLHHRQQQSDQHALEHVREKDRSRGDHQHHGLAPVIAPRGRVPCGAAV